MNTYHSENLKQTKKEVLLSCDHWSTRITSGTANMSLLAVQKKTNLEEKM